VNTEHTSHVCSLVVVVCGRTVFFETRCRWAPQGQKLRVPGHLDTNGLTGVMLRPLSEGLVSVLVLRMSGLLVFVLILVLMLGQVGTHYTCWSHWWF